MEAAVTLECRDLVKSFGGVRAVDGVNASFEAGRVAALVGPNGAGKTTLFHLMSGALRPDSGEVFYRGQRIDGLPPWMVAQMGVGRLFQDVRVFGKLTALENLLVAGRDQLGERVVHALLSRGTVAKAERLEREQAQRWLQVVALQDHADDPAEALSYGQQKLLAIARLLAAGADVFLLDEPTAGVNPILVDRVLHLIRGLAEDGKTVVLIEHNLNVVVDVADWVYFLDEGQVAEFGSPQEVMGDAAVRAAYLGL
jgi:ABC-type branched-subunit amino acid transport system ATPase component